MSDLRPPKYPSTPHWPQSLSVHRDDSYLQHPEAFIGKEVVITEKEDGGNTNLFNGEVYARSTGQPSHDGWMAMVRKHHAWKTVGNTHQVFYGEDRYGIHSIEYPPAHETDTFHLFAVRVLTWDDWFTNWDFVEEQARYLGVKTVPVLFRGVFETQEQITNWFREMIKLPSSLGESAPREGFVMRLAAGFNASDFDRSVTKFVRANHVQTDEHWTKNWQAIPLLKD